VQKPGTPPTLCIKKFENLQRKSSEGKSPTPNTLYGEVYIQKGDTKYLDDELLTHNFFYQLLRNNE